MSAIRTRAEYEKEWARVVLFIRSQSRPDLLSAAEIIEQSGTWLSESTIHRLRRTQEGSMEKGINTEEIGAQLLIEQIAAVVTKTHAHLGDGEKIGSEEGNQRVYQLLKRFDPSLLTRNEKRRLPRQ